MNLESLIISFSYLGIFLFLILNGIISFPSSQIIYVIAGYFAFTGDLNFWHVVLIGAIGNTIGNIVLYQLSKKKGLDYVLGFNKFIGFELFRKIDILKIKKVFQKKRGYVFLFFGKFINPIKVFIPIPAGIANMNKYLFSIIIFVTSFLWALIFTSIGYYFGKNFEFYGYYGIIMLVLVLIFGYLFYKYMNSLEIVSEIKEK